NIGGLRMMFAVFFFFQAEDGIRDDLVTGVQTCALPIFLDFRPIGRLSHREKETRWRDAGIRRDSCGLTGRPGMADGVKMFSWAGFGSVSDAKRRLGRLRTIQRNGLLSGR